MFKSRLPPEYQELLEYISPAAFKTVSWTQALRGISTLSLNLLNSAGRDSLAKAQSQILGDFVRFTDHEHAEAAAKGFRDKLAVTVLEYYFSQFFCNEGAFLDLRLKNFNSQEEEFTYAKNALWFQFSPSFRRGMLEIYYGFYFETPDRLKKGMVETGLIPADASEELFETTRELFASHFGSALNEPQEFHTAKFRSSFHTLFLHLKKHKIRLPSDFIFLGIYLSTLYQALEELGIPLDVKAAFLKVWNSLEHQIPDGK